MGALTDYIIKLLSSLLWYLMEDEALEIWIYKRKEGLILCWWQCLQLQEKRQRSGFVNSQTEIYLGNKLVWVSVSFKVCLSMWLSQPQSSYISALFLVDLEVNGSQETVAENLLSCCKNLAVSASCHSEIKHIKSHRFLCDISIWFLESSQHFWMWYFVNICACTKCHQFSTKNKKT